MARHDAPSLLAYLFGSLTQLAIEYERINKSIIRIPSAEHILLLIQNKSTGLRPAPLICPGAVHLRQTEGYNLSLKNGCVSENVEKHQKTVDRSLSLYIYIIYQSPPPDPAQIT